MEVHGKRMPLLLRLALFLGLVVMVAAALALWQRANGRWLLPWEQPVAVAQRQMQESTTRVEGIEAIAAIGDAANLPLVLAHLNDEEPTVRMAALKAVAALGSHEHIDEIVVLATDEDDSVREALAATLGQVAGTLAGDALRDMLTDETASVRRAAAAQLVATAAADHAALRFEELLGHADAQVRLAAIEAYAIRADNQPLVLVDALFHDDEAVRDAVRQTLGDDLEALVKQAVAATVGSRDVERRIEAARLVAASGDPAMLDDLLGLLQGERDEKLARSSRGQKQLAVLRETAVRAMVRMGPDILPTLLDETIIHERTRLAEAAAAEACMQFGEQALEPIVSRLARWHVFPDRHEQAMWEAVVRQLGGSEALSQLSLGPLPADGGDASAVMRIDGVRWRQTPVAAEKLPDDALVQITLRGGLAGSHGSKDVTLELHRRDGEWLRNFSADAPRYNKREHRGVLDNPSGAEKSQVNFTLYVFDDPFVRGGVGQYTVQLASGKYAGVFQGVQVEGDATVAVHPATFDDVARRAAANGHPRLIFRKDELAAMRRRAATPFGRRLIDALRDRLAGRKQLYREKVNWVTTWEPGMDAAIGHALLARLYNDKLHGERAAALMAERERVVPYGGEHGERFPGPVFYFPFAYDMGYDDLPFDLRKKIEQKFSISYGRYTYHNGMRGIFSVVGGSGLSIPGIMAVAIMGEDGAFNLEEPKQPQPFFHFVALDDEATIDDAPRWRFEADALITDWLLIESQDKEPFRTSEQWQRVTVLDARTVEVDGGRFAMQRIDESKVKYMSLGGEKIGFIELPKAHGGGRFMLTQLVMEKDTALVIDSQTRFGPRWKRGWFDGTPMRDGDAFILAKGVHRLVLEVDQPRTIPLFKTEDPAYLKVQRDIHAYQTKRRESLKAEHDEYRDWIQAQPIHSRCAWRVRMMLDDYVAGKDECRLRKHPWMMPFVHANWSALGQPFEPDTPRLDWLTEGGASVRELSDRVLCFSMRLADGPARAALKAEFDRRFAGDGLDRLDCLELVAALANYPLEQSASQR